MLFRGLLLGCVQFFPILDFGKERAGRKCLFTAIEAMPASRGGLTKKKTAMETLSSSKNIEKDQNMFLGLILKRTV